MLKLFKKLGGLGYEVETVSIAEDNDFFSRDIELSLSNDSAFTQHFVQMLECVLPTAGMSDLLIRRVKLLKKCDGGETVTVTLDVNGCIDVDSFTFDAVDCGDCTEIPFSIKHNKSPLCICRGGDLELLVF